MNIVVEPSNLLGYSTLSIDYLAHKQSARNLFLTKSPEQAVTLLPHTGYSRSTLIQVLNEQNKRYQSSSLTFDNIALLGNSDTLCVIAGQQPVLFGGPLYIMIKAVALAKQAKMLSKALDRVIVPVFWIDGDDHDFSETNHTHLLNHQGEIVAVSYNPEMTPAVSLGYRLLAQEPLLTTAKNTLYESMGQTEFTPHLEQLIANSYQINASMTDAFGMLMAQLTATLGIIYFCPTDNTLKAEATPFFKEIIRLQDVLHQQEEIANTGISQAGYAIQVKKKPDLTHLFYSAEGERQPIHREGMYFSTKRNKWSYDALFNELTENPHHFSTDVITRPLLQSYIFPVICQIAGPSELAYLAQVSPLFPVFNLVSPYYMPRPSATFIESRFQKIMHDYDISLDDLLGNIELTINRILASSFPQDLVYEWSEVTVHMNQIIDRFLKESLQFDKELHEFAKQTTHKIEGALEVFEKKVFSSHKKKQQVVRDRIYRLQKTLYMHQTPQERNLNIFYFLARYGHHFINYMCQTIDLNSRGHQLIGIERILN